MQLDHAGSTGLVTTLTIEKPVPCEVVVAFALLAGDAEMRFDMVCGKLLGVRNIFLVCQGLLKVSLSLLSYYLFCFVLCKKVW